MELGAPREGPAPQSGMRKVAVLVASIVVLLVLLIIPDWFGREAARGPKILAELDSVESELSSLKSDLGRDDAPSSRGLDGPIDLDAPLDLGGPTSRPAPSRDPVDTRARPDLGDPAAASGGREVDHEALWAAHARGDAEALAEVAIDPSYRDAGRSFALSLLATIRRSPVPETLVDLLEDAREAFEVREGAVYGLLEVQGEDFGEYLALVAERPKVASGADPEMARLVVLGFHADQVMGNGAALGAAAPRLMRAVRDGSQTARRALSFALAAPEPGREELAALEEDPTQPVVSENLLRFYRRQVEAGKDEYAARLAELEKTVPAGI